MAPGKTTDDDLFLETLDEVTVLFSKETTLGLPSTVFFMGLIFSVFFLAYGYYIVAIGLLWIYYPTMYTLHSRDPQFAQIIFRSLVSESETYCVGNYMPTTIQIVNDQQEG